MIDEQRIAEIEWRLARATPGPWSPDPMDHEGRIWFIETLDFKDVLQAMGPDQNLKNADFIANSPTDTRYLLDALKALREELTRERMKSRDLERKVRA